MIKRLRSILSILFFSISLLWLVLTIAAINIDYPQKQAFMYLGMSICTFALGYFIREPSDSDV